MFKKLASGLRSI